MTQYFIPYLILVEVFAVLKFFPFLKLLHFQYRYVKFSAIKQTFNITSDNSF